MARNCFPAMVLFIIAWFGSTTYGAPEFSGKSESALTNFSIDVWQVEQGLPGNTITSIAQTPDGYLWLGTFRGVVRFDGIRFETFGAGTLGLESERVTELFVDRKGELWLAMEHGQLSRYIDGRFTAFSTRDGWPGERAHSFAEAQDGTVFAATLTRVFQFREGRFTLLCARDATDPEHPMPVASDPKGTIWIGRDEILGVISNGNWSPLTGKLETRELRQIKVSRDGGLWVCANDRIRLLRDGAWVKDYGANSWPTRERPKLLEDSRGRLWGTTWYLGVFCFLPDGGMQRFSRDTGLPENTVRTVFEDRERNLWMGFNGGGLARLKPRVFQTFPRTAPLTDIIFGIAEDAQQRLWLGTLEDGLWKMEHEQFSPARFPGLELPWAAWTTLVDRSGDPWVAAHAFGKGGLVRFHDGTPTYYTTNSGLVHYDVLCLFESRDGAIWAGTEFGLSRYRDGKFSNYTKRDGLAANAIRAITEDGDGNIWIGTTGGGLHRLRDGRFTVLGSRDGLAGDSVQALLADNDGTLWVGTSKGLSQLRHGRFQNFSSKHGLPDDSIDSILDDGLGFLWLGTSHGIARVARTEFDGFASGARSDLDCTTYLKADGLGSIQCSSGGAPSLKARDGRLWFATLGGLSVVDPRQISTNQIPPQLVIEDVFVDGVKETTPGVEGEALKIPPGWRQVEVRYTGLSLYAPERVHFKFRLEGFDSTWQEVGTRRAAYYHGLPPGHYRFHVIAANNDGVWNDVGASLAFFVQPAIWQTVWFRALMVFALGAAAFAFYRWRVGMIEQRRRQHETFARQLLESQEAERRRIASELHDSLGQDLVLVKNLAALGREASSAAPDRFAEISTATARALDEVHAISYALRPPELDRLGLAKALAAMVRRAQESSGIQFDPRLELTNTLPPGADIQLFRIAQEAVNNLVQHSRAKSARVELWQDEAGLHLVIADDGCGFDLAARAEKTGLGIAGIKERVQLLGGKYEMISRPGAGTTISILAVTVH